MDDGDATYMGMSRRELLAGLAVAGAGAAALSGMAGSAEAAPIDTAEPFAPRGKLTKRPNFLIIMVDEERAPQTFESQALAQWRRENLHGQEALKRHGMNFTNHHIMSAACAPSRASIFTGHYPTLHGVSQTSGAAKATIEEDVYWLDPEMVPTMGDYFRTAGYRTWYRGKWHVSEADIMIPGSYQPLPSYSDRAFQIRNSRSTTRTPGASKTSDLRVGLAQSRMARTRGTLHPPRRVVAAETRRTRVWLVRPFATWRRMISRGYW